MVGVFAPSGLQTLTRAGIRRKYANGAVGSFTHVVALQGHNYSCELEVYADGYQFKYVLNPLG